MAVGYLCPQTCSKFGEGPYVYFNLGFNSLLVDGLYINIYLFVITVFLRVSGGGKMFGEVRVLFHLRNVFFVTGQGVLQPHCTPTSFPCVLFELYLFCFW